MVRYRSIGLNVSASVYDARTALLIGQQQIVIDPEACAESMYLTQDAPEDRTPYVNANSITSQLQSILAI